MLNFSFSHTSLKLSLWGEAHAECLEDLLVQHHSQCFIQLANVVFKQECAVCFLIPRNTVISWPSPASFSVAFPSTPFSVWVAVPIISIALQTQCTPGFYLQAD